MEGILLIDKAAGMTSHDVVEHTRRILGEQRVGHTGTLDPFATGVLVVLLGRATRLTQFLNFDDKEYEAVVRLGYSTDTGDLTGHPREFMRGPAGPRGNRKFWKPEEVEAALAAFRGHISQVPPMYSAKKIKGKKLYELARRGQVIERQSVRVRIFELVAVPVEGELIRPNSDGTCDLSIRVVCSSGTYIRVLAEDIGHRLGVGAHLVKLRRTRAGAHSIEDAVTLEGLEELAGEGNAESAIVPLNDVLPGTPAVHLTGDEAKRARNGTAFKMKPPGDWRNGQAVRIFGDEDELIAVAVYDARTKFVQPRVVFQAEV